MAYIFDPMKDAEFENGSQLKRKIKILKFLEAINIINSEKPSKIKYTELIPSPDKEKYELVFTLAKNDLVYLPDKKLSLEEMNEINWDNHYEISKYLHIVKYINPSTPSIFMFQKHTLAECIKITEEDAKNIFNNTELKKQDEEVKFGSASYRDNCIKVYIDRLGKKVVPYWKFPNGCWNKETAKNFNL